MGGVRTKDDEGENLINRKKMGKSGQGRMTAKAIPHVVSMLLDVLLEVNYEMNETKPREQVTRDTSRRGSGTAPRDNLPPHNRTMRTRIIAYIGGNAELSRLGPRSHVS